MSIWVFRKGRTTKYMYLSPHCDTYGDMDKSQVTLLASFDLSVAFDSVDNNYLLSRLSITSGAKDLPDKGSLISRNVLIMHVIFPSSRSPFSHHQGSVLGDHRLLLPPKLCLAPRSPYCHGCHLIESTKTKYTCNLIDSPPEAGQAGLEVLFF